MNVYYVGSLSAKSWLSEVITKAGTSESKMQFDWTRGLALPDSRDFPSPDYRKMKEQIGNTYLPRSVFIGDSATIVTLAHELGHIFGLDGIRAGAPGHGANLMTEPTRVDAVKLTDAQIKRMRDSHSVKLIGKSV